MTLGGAKNKGSNVKGLDVNGRVSTLCYEIVLSRGGVLDEMEGEQSVRGRRKGRVEVTRSECCVPE